MTKNAVTAASAAVPPINKVSRAASAARGSSLIAAPKKFSTSRKDPIFEVGPLHETSKKSNIAMQPR